MSGKNLEKNTISGILIEVDPDLVNDWDFMEQLSGVMAIQDKLAEASDPIAACKAMVSMNNLAISLYGENFEEIKKELRDQNNGKLPLEVMLNFIMETISALQKN